MDAVITELQTNNGSESSGDLPHRATSSRTTAFKNKSSRFKAADLGPEDRRERHSIITANIPAQNGSWLHVCKCHRCSLAAALPL